MKIKKREIFFYISYILLFISLFIGDVYDLGMNSQIAKIIRMLSYLFVLAQVFYFKLDGKELFKFAALFAVTLVYALSTKDLYWSILILIIYGSKNIEQDKILKISISLLICGIIIVLGLCLLGVLPDRITARDVSVADMSSRHSLGFYHSNVLPLVVLYLESYYIFLKKERVKQSIILLFLGIAIILNSVCNSRNAFGLTVLLSVMILFEKNIGTSNFFKKVAFYVSKYSVVVLSAFSYAMMFLLLRGGIWNTIDNFFSGRFRLGIFKMRKVGLHLVNLMSNEAFVSDSITYANGDLLGTVALDNGYIYVILRYGILIILFYFIISFFLSKKARGNMYVLCVLIIVFVANFVDNDLVDYSFLPFILFAFDNFQISERVYHKNKVKLRWRAR